MRNSRGSPPKPKGVVLNISRRVQPAVQLYEQCAMNGDIPVFITNIHTGAQCPLKLIKNN